MKKLIATLLVAAATLCFSFQAKAIEDPFETGTVIAGAHFGFQPFRPMGIGTTAYVDYVLIDSWWKGHFTVGGEFGYEHRWSKYYTGFGGSDYIKINYNQYAILTRSTYGLNITDEFEVHAGVLLGLGHYKIKYEGDTTPYDSHFGFAWGGLAGVRYFFTPSLAGSFEIQYTGYTPMLNLGVAFRF